MKLSRAVAVILVGFLLTSDVAGIARDLSAQNRRGGPFDNDDFRRRNDPFGRPKGANEPDMRVFWMMVLVFVAIGLAIGLAIQAVICWFMASAIGRVPPEYREIEPGGVWLLMIPLFSIIWLFFVVQRIPRSFQNYFEARERYDYGDCGAQLGLWYAICAVGTLIPYLGTCVGVAAFVLMIMFLVKLSELKNQIPESHAY